MEISLTTSVILVLVSIVGSVLTMKLLKEKKLFITLIGVGIGLLIGWLAITLILGALADVTIGVAVAFASFIPLFGIVGGYFAYAWNDIFGKK